MSIVYILKNKKSLSHCHVTAPLSYRIHRLRLGHMSQLSRNVQLTSYISNKQT